MASSEEEEREVEDDDLEEEEADIVRQKAYSTLLPEVREILGDEKPNLLKDIEQRVCLVCPTIQRFKGWRALMAHARTFKKKRALRHQGYFKALEEVITPNAEQREKVAIEATRIKQISARAAASTVATSVKNEQKVTEQEMEALRKERLHLWEISEQKEAIEQKRSVLQISLERDRQNLQELQRRGNQENRQREEEAKRDTIFFKRDMKELDRKLEEKQRRLEMKLNGGRKTDAEIMERRRYLQELREKRDQGTEVGKQHSQKLLELEEEKNKIESNFAVMTQELHEVYQMRRTAIDGEA